jgi:hypothetical protein
MPLNAIALTLPLPGNYLTLLGRDALSVNKSDLCITGKWTSRATSTLPLCGDLTIEVTLCGDLTLNL